MGVAPIVGIFAIDVAHERVMSRRRKTCQIRMSHFSRLSESCHVEMRHVSCGLVMSHRKYSIWNGVVMPR